MTTRRQFLRGAVSAAVAASLPASDGVELNSIAHPWDINLNPMDNECNPLNYIAQPPVPKFIFTNDANTGFYRAKDQLKLVAGGIQRLSLPFDLSAESLEEIEVDLPE